MTREKLEKNGKNGKKDNIPKETHYYYNYYYY
jgi:hypothetical protein